jgi:hypothetical protein
MAEAYRIKRGNLSIVNIEIPVDFGFVIEEDGVFYFEIYVEDHFNLLSFMDSNVDVYRNNYFGLKTTTVLNDSLEATDLSIIKIDPSNSFIKLHSSGFIKHTKRNYNYDDEDNAVPHGIIDSLLFLELEGLRMQFTESTYTSRMRNGVEISDFTDIKKDFTSAVLLYNNPKKDRCNNFKFTFFGSENSDNIYVELPHYWEVGPNVVDYELYMEIKNDLIGFLSLLNGATVVIRREFSGGYYSGRNVDSEIVLTHSFRTIKNESYNKYIPLNDPINVGLFTLEKSFLYCFDSYVLENKKLDLNSIIFYLCGAEQSRSIQERFFIQIIALERLAQKYIQTINSSDTFIVEESLFSLIKNDLIAVLDMHRKGAVKSDIDRLKGKIGDVNRVKRTSTEYKFMKLLEYARIDITPDIQLIIDEVRHKSVHHGEIGDGSVGVRNYIVLDELLRDIILNIINYNGLRISRYRVTTP